MLRLPPSILLLLLAALCAWGFPSDSASDHPAAAEPALDGPVEHSASLVMRLQPPSSASFGRIPALSGKLEGAPILMEDHDDLIARGGKAQGKAARSATATSSSEQATSKRSNATNVVKGEKLDFYETSFQGNVRNFIWNNQDPTKIMLLVDSTPFLSTNAGQTFDDISFRLEDFDKEQAPVFGAGSGGTGARAIARSALDRNYILILGKGPLLWQSKNGGDTFQKIQLSAQSSPLYLRRISLHPTQKDVVVGTHIDQGCLDGSINPEDPVCSLEIYLSKDFGVTWTQISSHVWSFFWGTYESKGVSKDSVYLLVSADQKSHQLGTEDGNLVLNSSPLDLVEVTLDDLVVHKIRTDVLEMISIGEYVYIVVSATRGVDILVSHLGGPFKQTSFQGASLRSIVFLDYSEGSVILIDVPNSLAGVYSDFLGDVWTSDSTGTHFTRSIRRVILQADDGLRFDFHKVESLEGTYVATVASREGKLRTKISWNRGGSWQDLKSQAGLDGLVNEETTPFLLYGDLHSASTGSHQGIYSEKSAPGGVLSVGGYGAKFLEYITGKVDDGDVFYSRNGGKTFAKILEKAHFCRFLDEGTFIICAPGSGTTTSFLYSLDQGITWHTETFISRPVNIVAIASDPDSFGLVASLIAVGDGAVTFVSVDLAELGLPPCTEKDFERWMPSDGQDERHCVMGHHSTFVRTKYGASCISTIDNFLVEKGNCACGEQDFECDVGYFLNSTSTCQPEVGTPVDEIVCNFGFYKKNNHYRLIPGNTCNATLADSVDLTAPVQAECPVENLYDENDRKRRLAIGLGLGMSFLAVLIAGVVLFVIWSTKKGYLQYRRVGTVEHNGETELEAPDHPEYDEDNEPREDEAPNPEGK